MEMALDVASQLDSVLFRDSIVHFTATGWMTKVKVREGG